MSEFCLSTAPFCINLCNFTITCKQAKHCQKVTFSGLPLVREKSGKFKVREKSGNFVIGQGNLEF